MKWRNSNVSWGLMIILNHWLGAVVILALFALGLWMVELTYYHSWYHKAPQLHKSIGLSLFVLTIFRILWRLFDATPEPLPNHSVLEQKIAKIVHLSLYGLLITIMLSGYFISTAAGQPIEVFNWFEIPALFPGIDKQEDFAGDIHYWLAICLMLLVLIHSIAALKHHVIDKDDTLKCMLVKLRDPH